MTRTSQQTLQRQEVQQQESFEDGMSLGRDSNGEEVYLHILVNRIRPEVEQLKKSVHVDEARIGI